MYNEIVIINLNIIAHCLSISTCNVVSMCCREVQSSWEEQKQVLLWDWTHRTLRLPCSSGLLWAKAPVHVENSWLHSNSSWFTPFPSLITGRRLTIQFCFGLVTLYFFMSASFAETTQWMVTIHIPTGGVWSRIETWVGRIFDCYPLAKMYQKSHFLSQLITFSGFPEAILIKYKK